MNIKSVKLKKRVGRRKRIGRKKTPKKMCQKNESLQHVGYLRFHEPDFLKTADCLEDIEEVFWDEDNEFSVECLINILERVR